MSEEAQEKQYKPSHRRLGELKKKGTFLRSRDMSSGIILIISITMIIVMAQKFITVLGKNFVLSFTVFDNFEAISSPLSWLYKTLAINSLLLLLPLLLILLIIPFLMSFLFGGFGLSMSLVKFKLERINPGKNLKKIVSFSNVIEIFKSVFKFLLLLMLLLIFLYGRSTDLLNLGGVGNENLLAQGMQLIKIYLLLVILGVVFIMAVDMLYSYFSYQKKIRMSHLEMKDEHKETDGNPESKRRVRQAQLAISRQRIRQDVPGATVIITNPTHYSVALKYDEKVDKAPKIVALGVDHLATEIRMIAIKNAIPIYEAPILARALFHTGKVGQNIHQDLYMAVAIVLSYIGQLRHYQAGLSDMPAYVEDLKIPEALHFDS